jgi:hypothetical protein
MGMIVLRVADCTDHQHTMREGGSLTLSCCDSADCFGTTALRHDNILVGPPATMAKLSALLSMLVAASITLQSQ